MAKVVGFHKRIIKTKVCLDCGAIIEFYPNEVQSKVENEPYGGGTDTYHYLQCPNCKKMMRWCGTI